MVNDLCILVSYVVQLFAIWLENVYVTLGFSFQSVPATIATSDRTVCKDAARTWKRSDLAETCAAM